LLPGSEHKLTGAIFTWGFRTAITHKPSKQSN